MSLPVSQYEALLAEVRGLRQKALHVQELATPLISSTNPLSHDTSLQRKSVDSIGTYHATTHLLRHKMDPQPVSGEYKTNFAECEDNIRGSAEGDFTCSEDELCEIRSTELSVSSEPIAYSRRHGPNLGTWHAESSMWASEPVPSVQTECQTSRHMEVTSVMSFASSSGGAPLDRILGSPNLSQRSSHQLEAKVDMVYSLLAMLGGQEHADMGETLLALSASPESCLAMRQSGCIPLLVQLVQSDKEPETRIKANQALQNLINAQPDERIRKREIRIFKLLEQARLHTEALLGDREYIPEPSSVSETEDNDSHPVQTVAHLMKLSFDEGHRHAICQLGGINVIANLIEVEHAKHGAAAEESQCILLRRYACMTLTNLTFGDSGNKALLCSYREFMRALVLQLNSKSDELRQVTASVLRNLSWRADATSKDILREVGTVTGLMKAAMFDNKENTLKSILSALWNLSAHSTENKAEICAIEGALGFLVDMLSYKTPSNTLTIIENSGGILRNISSQIAVRDDYREILRKHNCLQVLLDQLKSPSLTIVSNACGTLWNLSAKCTVDQEMLWEMGAPAMLRSLNHSKHKMIAMGSSAALKNLLSAKPKQALVQPLDSTARAMDLPVLPTLGARRQKALLQELDQNLAETFENIERESPTKSTNIENFPDKSIDFSSLNYSEPSTSYQKHSDTKKKHKTASSSLPYVTKNLPMNLPNNDDRDYKSSTSDYKGHIPNCGPDNDCDIKTTSKISKYTRDLSLNSSGGSCSSKSNDFPFRFVCDLDEKDHCSIESVSDADEQQKNNAADCCDKMETTKYESHEEDSDKSDQEYHEDFIEKQDVVNVRPKFYNEQLDDDGLIDESHNVFSMHQHRHEGNHSLRRSQESQSISNCCNTLHQSDNSYLAGSNNNVRKEISNCNSSSSNNSLVLDNAVVLEDYSEDNMPSKEGKPSIKKVFDNMELYSSTNKSEYLHDQQSVENLNRSEEKKYGKSFTEVKVTSEEQLSTALSETLCLEEEEVEVYESTKVIDNRMLDPDAMIESLDRFTAELVSQASHLQNKEEKITNSVTEGHTWDEDTSPNDITFPSLSGSIPNVITFKSEEDEADGESDKVQKQEEISNDYSSVNTSTLTESTLIAVEASKIATAFRKESELSHSLTSANSLELDSVQPPSHMNSLTSSAVDYDTLGTNKKVKNKRLPASLMVRRALSNSLNQTSSLESLEINSLTNLDLVNPPSAMADVLDLEGSMTSIASLPNENQTANRPSHPIFKVKQPISPLLQSDISGIENINPPSLLYEITDACNSLADVPTEIIADETEVFEDCCTHITDSTLYITDDLEFTDANNITPIQSDIGSSSAESTPKKNKIVNKHLTPKQRRNLARDRYKTYTVAAEMVMRGECERTKDESITDEWNSNSESTAELSSSGNDSGCGKLTPREKRKMDKSRFQTQVINASINDISQSPEKHVQAKTTIKENFLHKRKENRDRFKTQTLEETQVSQVILSSSPATSTETPSNLHDLLQNEAHMVLKTLKETKSHVDDFLECETLSLVSNEDDSENNSVNSINYRTYHKSWGLKTNGIPVVRPLAIERQTEVVAEVKNSEEEISSEAEEEQEEVEDKPAAKPKIVKPSSNVQEVETNDEEQPQVKAVRGRRKPLYSKTGLNNRSIPRSAKPIKSDLVKNVTSTIKSGVGLKSTMAKTNVAKPNHPRGQTRNNSSIKPPANQKPIPSPKTAITNAPKPSNAQAKYSPKHSANSLKLKASSIPTKPATLERQGTFTKDEPSENIVVRSKIPTISNLGTRTNFKMTKAVTQPSINRTTTFTAANRNVIVKSASSDRATKPPTKISSRSPSADSRERITSRRAVHSSPSTQSIKSNAKSGSEKRSSLPNATQCSGSSTSESGAKKQITSKIANLWKKIEQSKKQPVKNDNRVWIQPDATDKQVAVLTRNGTFGGEEEINNH